MNRSRRKKLFFGSSKVNEAIRQRTRKRREMRKLFLEPLEDRRLLAYNVTISDDPTAGGSFSGGVFTPTADDANVQISELISQLQANANVTVNTGTGGSQRGGVTLEDDLNFNSIGSGKTLTLQAADIVTIEGAILQDTPADDQLNLVFDADSDNNDAGIVLVENSIQTIGTISFLDDTAITGSSAVTIASGGQDISISGGLVVGNANGVTLDSSGGEISVTGTIESGNTYTFVSSPVNFNTALTDARVDANNDGDRADVGDSYLVTITSAVENSIVAGVAGYTPSWFGGSDEAVEGTWKWMDGPEEGQTYWVATGIGTGTATGFVGWGSGEPNNSGDYMWAYTNAFIWDDVGDQPHPYVQESNLAPTSLTLDAGAGGVAIGGDVGSGKELQDLVITSSTFSAAGINLAGDLSVTNSAAGSISGVVSGSATLTKDGAGTLTLSGASTYDGATTINAGTVAITNDTALGSSAVGTTVASGATLDVSGGITVDEPLTLNGTLVNSADDNTWSGNVTLGSTIDVAGGSSLTISGVVGGSALLKTGTGVLELSGANTYTGGTTISQGEIHFSNSDALGTGSVTLGDASTGASDVALLGTGVFNISNSITVTNQVTGAATLGSIDVNPPGSGLRPTTFSGTITLQRDIALQAGNQDRTNFNGQITGTGDVNLSAPFGNRRIVFERTSGSPNDFDGDLNIGADAILQLGVTDNVENRAIPDTADVHFATATSELRFAPSGTDDFETVGALISDASGAGKVTKVTGGTETVTLTVGANDASGEFSGAISNASGTLALTKVGTGTQTLSGSNSYGGSTTVDDGTLLVNGTNSGTGDVVVNSGATLGGTGSLGGAVTVNSGGTITGGTLGAVGELTVGGLSFNGGTYQGDLLGNTSDRITSAGTVDLDTGTAGVFDLNVLGGTTTDGTLFRLISNTGTAAISDVFSNVAQDQLVTVNSLTGNYSYAGGEGGNDLVISVQGNGLVFHVDTPATNNDFRLVRTPGATAAPADDQLTLYQGVTINVDASGAINVSGGTIVQNWSVEAAGTPITSITIDGNGGIDNLVIDYTGEDGLEDVNVTFAGGAPASSSALYVKGGATPYDFGKVVYEYLNANDGRIDNFSDPAGTVLQSSITYTGLSPITSTVNAANVVLNYTGGAETVTVSAGAAAGQTNATSTLGENTTFNNPTDSLTVQTFQGSGADTVNIQGVGSGFDADLTVDGDTDDTINFQTTATSIGNGDLEADARTINVNAALTTGTVAPNDGSIDLTATRNIAVGASGSLNSNSGDITLAGNAAGTTAGNFAGILLTDATIQSATGGITMNGTGGDADGNGIELAAGAKVLSDSGAMALTGASPTSIGIQIRGTGSEVRSTASGTTPITLTLDGTGAQRGIQINQDGSVISEGTGANAADIVIIGTGTGTFSRGITLGNLVGAGVISSVDGDITLEGTGVQDGVDAGYASEIKSTNGEVTVNGTGGSQSNGRGVHLFGAASIVGSSNPVTVTGTKGSGVGSTQYGVQVDGAGSQISSTGGSLTVVGQGGGTGNSESGHGVVVSQGGEITAGGTGAVGVTGTGGAGTGTENFGVLVTDANSVINSGGGDVTVTGQGGGSGASGDNRGVVVAQGGQITAGGSGNVEVTGTGGSGSGGSQNGVQVDSTGSEITSSGGNVTVEGQGGGSTSAGASRGVSIGGGGEISAGGAGTVSVTGTGGAGGGTGVAVAGTTGNPSAISSSGGAVTVDGQGGGSGSAGNSQGVSVSIGQITAGGSGTVTVTGTGGSGSGANNSGVVLLGGSASVTGSSGGGDVTVTGSGGGSGGATFGVGVLSSGGQITAAGTGTLTVTGTGGPGTGTNNHGVLVSGSSAAITAEAGDVTVTGTAGSGSGPLALSLAGGGTVSSDANVYVIANGAVQGDATSKIEADSLGISGNDDVLLGAGPNDVNTLAVNTSAGEVQFRDVDDLTVGSVAASGSFPATSGITAAGNVTVTTDDAAAAGQDLTVSSGVTVESTGGNVTLNAGDNLSIPAGATVDAGGTVTLAVDAGDADPGVGGTLDMLGTLDTVTQASLLGGPDDDTINLDPQATTGTIRIDGAAGDDSYTVQLGNLGGQVDVDDQASEGTDSLTITASSGDDALTVNPTQTTLASPAQTVTYTAELENLQVNAGDGQDTIDVTPSTTAAYSIFGGDPAAPASPGDVLNFATPGGQTATLTNPGPDSGTIVTSGGYQDVDFDEIELLNFTGSIEVDGSDEDDLLVIDATGPDGGTYQLTTDVDGSNGGPFVGPVIGITGVTDFLFNSLAGDDIMRINNPAGGLFAPSGGIQYDAGADDDWLEVLGGSGTSGSYTVGPGADEGTLTATGGGVTQTITFTGLEPILHTTTLATFDVNASAAGEVINIIDGPTASGDQTLEVNFGGAFELIQLAGKAALNVNGLGGTDTISVYLVTASTGLATLTVDGGGDADTINLLQSTPAGVTTNLHGGDAADTFDFTAGVLLTGNVDGNAGEDTLDLSAYTTPRSVQLTGIGGTDGYAGTEAAISGSFTNIDDLLAPAAGGDTLSGADLNTTWDLTGSDSGSITDGIAAITSPISGHVVMPLRPGSGQDMAFTSFENLVGGAESDWFDLSAGVGTSGPLDGGAGNDTLDYRDYTTAVAVDLSAGTGTNITGNVVAGTTGSSIENVFAGSAADTLTGDVDDNVLGDGLGSDVLSGGTGSDRYVLEPGTGGSLDELNETPATGTVDLDTVDFSLATAGVVFDMDLLEVPQDVFGGNTVQLNREAPAPAPSGFENFIGSDYADTVDIDPLAVVRSVEGNDPTTAPGDTLNFDAGGSIVIDNSTSLTAGGVGTVLYSEIETIDLFDVAPRIIDNGDVGWNFAGPWTAAATEGYLGDFHYIASGSGTDVASWTFDGVTPGQYLVSATWPARSDRASDATYSVQDGTTPVGSPVAVDQQTDPTDFLDNGVLWQDLGLYTVASHTLRVELSGLGTGTVVADAIRIERVNVGLPEIRVLEQDTLQNIPDGVGVSEFGTTPVGTPVTKTYVVQNLGTVDLNLGAVTVPAGFTAGSFSQNPVPAGASATLDVTMDAAAAGTFAGELSFGTDDRNEDPFNFSLLGSAADAPPAGQIVDNDDPGFSLVSGTWQFNGISTSYFQNDHRWHAPGTGSDVVQWEFTVTPGSVYRVSGTWAETWNRASDAPFTISDGVNTLTVDMDQGTLPADYPNSFSDQDADWVDLAPAFVVDSSSSGTLTVQLSDDADGYLIADAIRIEELSAPEIAVFDGTQEIVSGSSVVDYGVTQTPLTKTFTVKNVGSDPLTLVEPIQLSLGFSLVSSFGSLTLQPNETTTFAVQLDAAAPGQVSGTVSFVNNDADEDPFVFTVTGQIIGSIVDDNDPGWTVVSGTWPYSSYSSGYFQNDHHYHAPGDGSSVVQWEFTDLIPGASYELSATWFGTWNRASDAPYTISDGVSSVTVDMDQGTAPNDVSEAGAFFERLTVFKLDSSADSLTVQLSDDADGYVIADAVRLERTYLPEIEVTQNGSLVTDGQSVIDYGEVLLTGQLTKTFSVANTGDLPLILQEPIAVTGSGFTASGFGDDVLNPGQTTTFTVTLDASTVGTALATLSFGSNDVDENPFTFDVTAEVVGSRIRDNQDAGWSIVSGTWSYNGRSAGYFQNDHHYRAPGTGANVVQWEFADLEPGATYQVSATWSGTWNRASDAPYTISDGISSVTVDKDQGTAPNDFTDAGANWEFLADFTLAAGSSTLTVQLSDDADGYLIADAVRIVRLGPLQAAGGPLFGSTAAALETSQAEQMLSAAVDRWSAAGLDPASVAALSRVGVAVDDLPGATLGLADSSSRMIRVDIDAAGYGWFVDATPQLDEEYGLPVDGLLRASGDSDAAQHIDLLTVMAHELGHMLGLGDLGAESHSGDLMAETLSAGVRKVPDGAVSRVEPMRTQSQAAVHAADRAFAAMMSRSAVGPVNHNQHGPARSAATDPAVHPQTLFDDVDELLGDPTEGLFEILDDWLLHE